MDDESGTELSAAIAAAWGRNEPPRKGPKRALSLQQIVEAGIDVAGRDGLAAVSMSRVAAEIPVSTMALYRYVASKDELLTLMVDSAYGPPPEIPADADWRSSLTAWARAEHAALLRHRWILRVPISGPPLTPNQVGWFERGVVCLSETGLTAVERLSSLLLVTGFVRNEATLMDDIDSAALARGVDPESVMATYRQHLASLIDPERFPALSAAIDAGIFAEPDGPDDEFVFGLERILDGIGVLIEARHSAAGLLR